MARKLVYLIACTVDGFIAGEDGSVDFFPMSGEHLPFLVQEYPETMPGHLRQQLGVHGRNRHFGAVLMGRRTYEVGTHLGITSPYSHLDQFVMSSTMAESPDPRVRLVRSDPLEVVRRLKREPGLDIWLCGGAGLAGVLYEEIDELILKVNPVMLGAGTPLFRGAAGPTSLELTSHQTFAGGVAIHHYRVRRV